MTPDSGSRNTSLLISPLWQLVGSARSPVCWAGTDCTLVSHKDSLGISMFLHWWDMGKVMRAFVYLTRAWVVAGWLKHKVCYGEIDHLKNVRQWKPLEGRRHKNDLILILNSMQKVREEDSQNIISEPDSNPTEVNEKFPLVSMDSELDCYSCHSETALTLQMCFKFNQKKIRQVRHLVNCRIWLIDMEK